MRLIVGLGNPGEKYKNNRHNVGHMVIDALKETKKELKNTVVAKSNTFMNSSGSFISQMMQKYNISVDDLWVIHDDLDIKLGEYKIQKGKGPKIHNGLNNIYEKIGTIDFWHVRVGVDNRSPENRTKGEDYVLEDFGDVELEKLGRVTKEICKKLEI